MLKSCWGYLTTFSAGNKTLHLSPISYSAKIIHHYHCKSYFWFFKNIMLTNCNNFLVPSSSTIWNKTGRTSHRRCSIKKVLLKISQNSQEDSGTGVFLWILWNFQEHLFTEHLWTTASESLGFSTFDIVGWETGTVSL